MWDVSLDAMFSKIRRPQRSPSTTYTSWASCSSSRIHSRPATSSSVSAEAVGLAPIWVGSVVEVESAELGSTDDGGSIVEVVSIVGVDSSDVESSVHEAPSTRRAVVVTARARRARRDPGEVFMMFPS